jgi:hypothetical protein
MVIIIIMFLILVAEVVSFMLRPLYTHRKIRGTQKKLGGPRTRSAHVAEDTGTGTPVIQPITRLRITGFLDFLHRPVF